MLQDLRCIIQNTPLNTASEMADALTPVYPATEGISQSPSRSAAQALAMLETSPLADLLESKEDYNLNDIGFSIGRHPMPIQIV